MAQATEPVASAAAEATTQQDETPQDAAQEVPGGDRRESPPRELPETDSLEETAAPEDDTLLADESVEVLDVPADDAQADAIVAQRSQLAQRIRSSRKLPKGLRDRLAEVVETLQFSGDAETVPTVPVAEAVEMIEAAIPENLQFAEGPLVSPAHPRGEGFFTGGTSRLSNADAQRIAREQLAATGFGAT